MTRKVELGVFMPVGSNGFLMSKRTPRYHPTFALHKEIAQTAEAIGIDYLFWMGKWMGFGGESGFWNETIEPITMASAIAACTDRVRLYATINPLLFQPAVAAKIIATADQISNGRFGINIVTGNTLEEIKQMIPVADDYSDTRYAFAEEWLTAVKSLWTNERTTLKGRYFTLTDCVSDPKPRQKPYPTVVSASLSEEGLRFAARHSDVAFMGLRPGEMAKVKGYAAEVGRTIKTATNIFILQRRTDADAQAEFEAIRDNLDQEAMDNLVASFERDNRESYGKRTEHLRNPDTIGFGTGRPVIGSAQTVAEKLAAIFIEGGVDSAQFTFVDFVADLKAFGRDVLPLLAARLQAAGITLSSVPVREVAA